MFCNLAMGQWLKLTLPGWQALALGPSLQNKFPHLSFRRVPAVLALAFFLSFTALSEHQPQARVLPSALLWALRLLFSFPPTAWWPRCGPQGEGARERVWPSGILLKHRAVMQTRLFGSFPPALATLPPNMIITAQSYKVAFHSTHCPAP